jgi:hypothetical protein
VLLRRHSNACLAALDKSAWEAAMVSPEHLAEITKLVNRFVCEQRQRLRATATPLPAGLVNRYDKFFERVDLLDQVNVAFENVVPNPTALNDYLKSQGLPQLDFATYFGMTFVDTILLSKTRLSIVGFGSIESNPKEKADATLVHELIHAVQYAALRVDPADPASIDKFTKEQIRGYLQWTGVEAPPIRYPDITFEDAATIAEEAYCGELDGIEVTYRFMTARQITYEPVD